MKDEPDSLCVSVPPPEFINKSRVEHVLDDAHQRAFSRAVRNITSTHLAIETFAQIVDGLPLRNVALANGEVTDSGDPVLNHVDLYPGAWEKTKDFLAELNPAGLEISVTVRGVNTGDIAAGMSAAKTISGSSAIPAHSSKLRGFGDAVPGVSRSSRAQYRRGSFQAGSRPYQVRCAA